MHGNNKTEARAAARLRRRDRLPGARLVRGDRAGRAAARPPAGRPDPGHARDQAVHPLLHPDRPARLEVRLRARGRARGRGGAPRARVASTCDLVGIHAHIGSQIFELEPYVEDDPAARRLHRLRLPAAERRRRPRHRLHRRGRARLDRGLRRRQGAGRAGRRSTRCRGSWSSRAARWSATPASPPTGSARSRRFPGVRTYVAVDGGMSDNLRPMLYGARYEAAIADRPDAPATHVATIAGMHCESGDILIKEVALPEPRDRRRARHAGDRRLRVRDGEQLQRRSAAAGDLLQGRRGARRRAPRDLRGPGGARRMTPSLSASACSVTGRSGRRSTRCSPSAPTRSRPRPGGGPSSCGVLTRSRGSFDEILDGRGRGRRADRRHRAGARVRAARARGGQAARDRQQAAAQPARRRAVRRGARRRARSCATRPRSRASCPVIRVMRESFAGAHIEKVHGIVNGTTNYILSEMARTGASYADALARAQELGYAEADPTEDVNGKDAAAKMAILARLAFHAVGDARPGAVRGHRGDHARRHRLREGVRARAEAARRRGAARRRRQRARVPLLPLRRPSARLGGRARSTRSRSSRRRSPR